MLRLSNMDVVCMET